MRQFLRRFWCAFLGGCDARETQRNYGTWVRPGVRLPLYVREWECSRCGDPMEPPEWRR